MTDLTPANQALIDEDPAGRLRVAMGADFSLSARDIAQHLVFAMDQLVMAEEYPHPVLSKAETISRAQERVDLCIKALKDTVITDIKTRRGEWVVVA